MAIELIEPLVGNSTGAKVLLYLANYGDGYASGIARTFALSVSQVLKQLERFEQGGILVQRPLGRTRLYTWNPRWPLRQELQAMLQKALTRSSEYETQAFFRERRRPRLKGKPYELISQD